MHLLQTDFPEWHSITFRLILNSCSKDVPSSPLCGFHVPTNVPKSSHRLPKVFNGLAKLFISHRSSTYALDLLWATLASGKELRHEMRPTHGFMDTDFPALSDGGAERIWKR